MQSLATATPTTAHVKEEIMDRMVRSKLTMMGRALDFAHAHPSTDASWTALVTRSEELLARAVALSVQEREGRVVAGAAVMRRRELRRQMQELVAHLVRVAQAASETTPALVGIFELPRRGPHRLFEAAVKVLLSASHPNRELFIAYGLGETTLSEIEAALSGFEAAGTEQNAARREHVGARAELLEIADRCMEVVARLEGLVRVRFRNDIEQLAAWESARSLITGFRIQRRANMSEVQDGSDTPLPSQPAVENEPDPTQAMPDTAEGQQQAEAA